jgi:hypothetical protein
MFRLRRILFTGSPVTDSRRCAEGVMPTAARCVFRQIERGVFFPACQVGNA